MAHLSWHGKVLKTWQSTTTNNRYYLTEMNWLLWTSGPRGGKCKVKAKPSETIKREQLIQKLNELVAANKFSIQIGE